MIIPVFGAGNFHRDGDEFSSRGNFIYITREINPDRGGKRMYVMRRMLKGYAKGRMRYAPTDMQADNCRGESHSPNIYRDFCL
jgi:hypothetical protein